MHILLGILLNPWLLALLITPDGVIDSSALRIILCGSEVTALTVGILLLRFRRRIKLENIILFAGTLMICLVFGETTLALLGYQPRKTLPHEVPRLSSWWRCDSLHGCYVVRSQHSDSLNYNQAGFRDRDEFKSEAVDTSAFRILLLGDSYTFGYSAIETGMCFAEVVEARSGEPFRIQLWNTGIPGIGQKQELHSLKEYAPILKPQLVILAFVMNDFVNNRYPMGIYYSYEDGKWIDRYGTDPSTGRIIALTPEETYTRACFPSYPAGYLELSRLYCKFTDTIEKAYKTATRTLGLSSNVLSSSDIDITRNLLSSIRDYILEHNSRFLVLIVPERIDIVRPGEAYETVLSILDELDIHYLEVIDQLDAGDYAPDGHWNIDGHYKVGMKLVEEISHFRKR